jgi:hypothetical protein
MHNFKDLIVWKKSRELMKDIYTLTQNFPTDEKYGLTQQIRRAVVERLIYNFKKSLFF